MVIDDFDYDSGSGYFIIRPNRSLSWRTNKLIIGAIAFVCLSIAIVWGYIGAWMILPFAGIEVLLVAICFYLCVLKTTNQEVIQINSTRLVVEHGRRKPQIRTEFLRENLKLDFYQSDNDWENGHLILLGGKQKLEIGQCLNRGDKQLLATKLARILL